jgi:outer membrane lipase/esterase
MQSASKKRRSILSLVALVLLAPSWAVAQVTFGQIVVFGTSLSDPGNAFALTGQATTPPYNTLDLFLIPSAPYAKGGHHFSNGATWVEQLARSLGLAGDVRAAFQGSGVKASNYAVGGARARDDGINVDLSTQVSAFLGDVGGVAPSDALYVVEMGGNDIRDALVDLPNAAMILTAALTAIGNNLGTLYVAGARKFLVWNVPNIGLTPAVRSAGPGAVQAATVLTQGFNAELDNLLAVVAGLPGVELTRFDAYQAVNELVTTPEAFGLSEVEAACITPNLPPFACQTPDEFLFWDGIHPTKAVHAIFAHEAASALVQ